MTQQKACRDEQKKDAKFAYIEKILEKLMTPSKMIALDATTWSQNSRRPGAIGAI
jgi:hypothetical protein